MKQVRILLILIVALTGFSCQPEEASDQRQTHTVEIWTLKNYSVAGECAIDPNRLEEDEKVIANEEILAYYATDHYFVLTAAAINRLKKIQAKTFFYLKVDDQMVYTGLLMSSYLSLVCFGIIIDPISYGNNTIQVRYQYATTSQPNDQRNNAVLLKALEEQGKLKN